MNYEKIGKFIKELRMEKYLTQKDLALKLNITDKAISKWERGLGCPDVSILESLSEALDVSILEILKGRKINKEELNNNVDEYILDTVNYSNKQMSIKYKNIILNILSTIIIVIICILILLNIYHITYLNKEYKYNFNSDEIISINNNLNKIEENINTIKNSKFKYNQEDYKKIKTTIENNYELLKKHPLLNYQEKKSLNINDLYVIDSYNYDEQEIYFLYELLGNYESKMNDYLEHYKTTLLVKGYNGISLHIEPSISYKYNINNDNYFIDEYKVSARVYNLLYMSEELLILTNNVIEVGELDV